MEKQNHTKWQTNSPCHRHWPGQVPEPFCRSSSPLLLSHLNLKYLSNPRKLQSCCKYLFPNQQRWLSCRGASPSAQHSLLTKRHVQVCGLQPAWSGSLSQYQHSSCSTWQTGCVDFWQWQVEEEMEPKTLDFVSCETVTARQKYQCCQLSMILRSIHDKDKALLR